MFSNYGVAAPPPRFRVIALALCLRRIEPKVSTGRVGSVKPHPASRSIANSYGELRHQLFVGSEARFLFGISFRRWRLLADIMNLPCIMPFGEGFLPTLTLNHSLRRHRCFRYPLHRLRKVSFPRLLFAVYFGCFVTYYIATVSI